METPKKPKAPKNLKTEPQELKIVVSTQLPESTEKALSEPIMAGNKLSLPKTWFTEKQSLKIMQRTPAQYIYERPGKGGQKFKYVPVKYIEKTLNFIFGWNWDFQILSKEVYLLESGHGQIVTHGRLVVKNSDGTQTVTKEQFGSKEVAYLTEMKGGQKVKTNIPLNLGNDFKASASDCLKKCASELGIASDVYGANEYREIKAETSADVQETTYEAIKSMIANAKNPNALKALNISVGNAKISDDEKQELYDLIKAKAENAGATPA